jgi:hypothetical protein
MEMTETNVAMRLERLERSNRRLKASLAVTLISVLALAAIGATEHVPEKITAREFDVVDGQGRARIVLTAFPAGGGATMEVLDAARRIRASITADDDGDASLVMRGSEESAVNLHVIRGGYTGLAMGGPPGSGKLVLSVDPSRPSVDLEDARGFEMTLGAARTVTPRNGETQQTSAASITMFGNDKDHRVIWQAP